MRKRDVLCQHGAKHTSDHAETMYVLTPAAQRRPGPQGFSPTDNHKFRTIQTTFSDLCRSCFGSVRGMIELLTPLTAVANTLQVLQLRCHCAPRVPRFVCRRRHQNADFMFCITTLVLANHCCQAAETSFCASNSNHKVRCSEV